MSEAMPQTIGFLVKGAFLFLVVIIVLFFVNLNVGLEIDDKGAEGLAKEFVLLNDCLSYVNEAGLKTNYIDFSKIDKENLRKCGGGVRVTVLNLDDEEIIEVDSDDERSIQIPLCDISEKDIKCINSRNLVRIIDNGKVDTIFLDLELVI